MITKYSFGGFKFAVPSSWRVGEIDGAVEVVDAEGEGALHLSLITRTKTDSLSETDAQLLVDSFAYSNGLVPDGLISSTIQATEARAVGQFRPIQPTVETPLHWLVGCVVWPNRAVRASYCTDSVNEEKLNEATAIIESIQRGVS